MRITKNKDGVVVIDMEGAVIVDGESKGKHLIEVDSDNILIENFDMYSYRKKVGGIRVNKNSNVENVKTYSNLKPKIQF
tara:strand:+ start:340 stop:576 length:237 start_codon:yes stop_codon:yes gene_type:complete